MNATCVIHPDRVAAQACAECGAPVCDDCTVTVRDKPVCRRCVEAIRARVASEMAAAPAKSPSAPVGAAAPHPAHLLMGILYGAVFGLVGAFILAKFEYYSNFQ